jgi:DNA polymerase-3 subunit beta
LNWQHCNHTVYFPTWSYEQYYQAIRRFWRFGQKNEVIVDLVYSDGQERVLDALRYKTQKAKEFNESIQKAINKTLFATGNDDLRPVMSGVFCQFSPQDITFVATDAHKLVRYRRTDSEASGSSSFILPKKPLNLLRTNLSGNEEVLVEYNESNAVFTFGDIVLICRLIDGKYPNYEAVIPKENPNVLTIDRLQFLSSIKRVSIFANKTTHQVKLKLAGS